MTEIQDNSKTLKSGKKPVDYQNRIINVSVQLFKEQGVEHVTMHQIAKVAEIGQATLYRRYSNIGEICMAILSNNTQDFLKELDEFLLSSNQDQSPLAQLSSIIEKIADYIDGKATMLVVIKNEYSRELQLLQFNHPVFLYLHEIISGLYSKSIQQQEIGKLNVTLTTHSLVAALSPDLFLYQQQTLGFCKEEIIASVRQIYIESLKK
ncbi:TetR/AcrR family transcriptional regulator [Planococcus versutus]|uniref:HTH tetR-type domain-containing protein n=1 Tax=Planococcus versutus TaxID=1302659 RepID=A0A1B1RZ71_9BACL|nr:TetR/AcrR family transcriptional regulator [Planococcus versutus]ANU26233.1 hypothetical protein I858_004205 [Planococcus versutus]